jgi:glyoxylase-like metal-dependent hydrolase (beta-lactamase superfamily II)
MFMMRAIPVLLMTTLLAACNKAPEPQPAAQEEVAATPAEATNGDVYRFSIGDLTAFALKDGSFVFKNDSKTFAIDRSPEDVTRVLEAASVPTDELSLSIQPLLVRSGDRVLLFDTGTGSGAETAGKLVASMSEAGIEPASVTDIFISHAHGDHIGGVVDANRALVFPNATVRMSAPEWDALKATAGDDANRVALIEALTPKIETFAPGAEIVPAVVKAVDIKGHTPGHSGYLITSGAESLLYIGDTAHHYIISVQEPDWTIQFDRDAPTAQSSRKELIATSAQSQQRIYAVHFPFPGIGHFTREGERFVWTAEQ